MEACCVNGEVTGVYALFLEGDSWRKTLIKLRRVASSLLLCVRRSELKVLRGRELVAIVSSNCLNTCNATRFLELKGVLEILPPRIVFKDRPYAGSINKRGLWQTVLVNVEGKCRFTTLSDYCFSSFYLNLILFHNITVCFLDFRTISTNYLASSHHLREPVATFKSRPLDGTLVRGLGAIRSSLLCWCTIDN